MTTYKIFSNNPTMAVRDGVTFIPIAEKFASRFADPDFQEYQKWLDAGNAPEYVTVVEVPEVPEVPPTEQVFALPIRAPIMTAEDFIVQSPKPKTDPLQALEEAIIEAAKADKSVALIALDLVVYIEEVEKRLKRAKI